MEPLSLILCATTLFIVVCFVFYHTIFLRKVLRWKASNIPFVHPVFPIGHKYVLDICKTSITNLIDRTYQDHEDKDLVALFFGTLPVIFVRDPKLVQKMLVRNSDKTFATLFPVPAEETELQNHPFLSTDKAQWKTARSTMAPMFSPSWMKGLQFEKFKVQIERLWCYLEKKRLGEQPISAMHVADHFIWDSVSLTNFSEDSNSYEQNPELLAIVRQFYDISVSMTLKCYLQMNFPFILSYMVKLFGSLKVVPQKHIEVFRRFLEGKINYRINNKVELDDAIDHFILAKETGNVPTEKMSEITLRQMTGHTLSILYAGTDTVSYLCYTTVHTLSLHPEYQDRIKREIDDVMNKHNVFELTFEVIRDLQFTEQCIYETSRLIPLPMFHMRRCSEDFKIPGTDYSFRKGDIFIASPYSIQRDPKYFKDPDTFDPERFSPENRTSFPSDAYISFGLGLRKCPGYKLGVLQVALFIASLLIKYEIGPRSHLKQMTADDFSPLGTSNVPKEELLIDLILRQRQD